MYVPPPIAGEGYPLSAQQRELLATASRLGREKFAPRAAQYDRDATFPFENYDDMRAAGLLRICVPKRYGGLGADFVTYSHGRRRDRPPRRLDRAHLEHARLLDAVERRARRRPRHDARPSAPSTSGTARSTSSAS